MHRRNCHRRDPYSNSQPFGLETDWRLKWKRRCARLEPWGGDSLRIHLESRKDSHGWGGIAALRIQGLNPSGFTSRVSKIHKAGKDCLPHDSGVESLWIHLEGLKDSQGWGGLPPSGFRV